MKIECDKCAAKYSIADEKVRGKTFKIRCKKCSNVIIVRDKAAAAVGGGGADVAVDQAQPGWHLAINGETVGPMSEDEVRQRYEAAEIDKDTAIWQEGFEDWIPLGDVDVFAELPDQPPADGDDPFASANQDDYAGSAPMAGGGGGADPFGAVASQPQAAAQSPRVSSLTGQRNENSVLFSLDSLQSIASGGGAQQARPASTGPSNQAAGTKGLATVAPGSEGSGLIDIRALGAMVGAGAAQPSAAASVAPMADDPGLPSFGGAGLGGLSSAPLVPQQVVPAAAAAAPAPQRSNLPIYLMMVVLILLVAGLGGYIATRPEPVPTIIERTVQADAPSVKGAVDEDDDKKDDEDEDEDEDEDNKDADGDGKSDEEGGEDPDPAVVASAKSKGKGKGGRGKGKGGKGKGSSTPKKPSNDGLPGFDDPTPPKSSKGGSSKGGGKSDVGVECILDPSKCKKGPSKPSTKKPSTKKPATADANLPEKLTTTDIKAGVAPVKAKARACGGKHGAPAGTKVKVKLSIAGATGRVSSATPQAPHGGTALGNCVAKALKAAKFKKFKKASVGAVYPITL